jgi:hypothetical protein
MRVMMVAAVMMPRRRKGRRGKQQHERENQQLLHGVIVASFSRSSCGKGCNQSSMRIKLATCFWLGGMRAALPGGDGLES